MTTTLRVGIGLFLGVISWGLVGSSLFAGIHFQTPTPTPSGRVVRPTPTPIPTPKVVPIKKRVSGKGVKSGSGGRRREPIPPKIKQPVLKLTPQSISEPEMVFVRGGTFKMGSPEGTGYDDERPQHDVTVPSFYMGKFEITQRQWKAVMGIDKNPSHFKGDNLPVENVSWDDAKEFCQKLSQWAGKTYRLPTEAEWEYACRAGTTGDYAGKLDEMSNQSSSQTYPVGRYKPNAFGLYDMHGNVWEWCEDVWHDSYKNAPQDGSAWLSGGDSSRRVVRGGSGNSDPDRHRSALRHWHVPGPRSDYIGFRVAVSARNS